MSNVSDIIEEFLLEILKHEEKLDISRNELAAYFACAPSQINYVLSTRFTPDRGYTTESKRGGGGFISVIKLSSSPDAIYNDIFSKNLSEGVSYNKGVQIIERIRSAGLIKEAAANMLKVTISDKALIMPTAKGKDALRLSILRAVYLEIKKGGC